MPINYDAATEEFGEAVECSWTSKDALLYALGVGAGTLDPTGFELEFTTENSKGVTQRVLPTFAVTVGFGLGFERVGTYNRAMLVHGEQAIELHREIPPEGTGVCASRVAGIYDKGSGALAVIEYRVTEVTTTE